MTSDAILIDDRLWERLFDISDRGIALCYQCGVCTAACPWGLVRQKPLSVRTLIRQAQLGIQTGDENLWLCTTCGQCQTDCPRAVDIPGIFRSLRLLAWEQRAVEKGLPSLLWSLYWNDNPWSQPPSQKAAWAGSLDIPLFDPSKHEIMLYIGCTSSYDRRAQKIARALVSLLRSAGVQFGFLGNEEPCCGEAALSVGHQPYFAEIAAHTAQVFQSRGVKRLVSISPHCYDVFMNCYPEFIPGLEALHYTQYLTELLEQDRLVFRQAVNQRATFQDPCYLGRLNGEYNAPRRILSAIPGIEIVEMEHSHQDALCCGGGGGRMWLETPSGERFSDLRIKQAVQTGARYLVTACPFCIVCLEDSAKIMAVKDLDVMDVSELAVMAGVGQ
jgi:Fe-S oxidoreductase